MKDAFLNRINCILENHFQDEHFQIAQLCAKLDISRIHLHRKITHSSGVSTSHYIRSFRLRKAKALLEQTNLRISEVAYQSGFGNISYFTTSFSKEFGGSPKSVRKHKKDKI